MKKAIRFVFVGVFTLCAIGTFSELAVAKRMQDRVAPTLTTEPIVGQTETLLPDGRVLLVGGKTGSGLLRAVLSIRDPQTGSTVSVGALNFPRAFHTATVLPQGSVLILGGVSIDGKVVPTAELFDPASAKVTVLTSGPTTRASHTATLLTDGRLLVAGGISESGTTVKTLELWDSRKKSSATVPQVTGTRVGGRAQLLADGRVLLSGGNDDSGKPNDKNEIYDPQSNATSLNDETQSLLDSGESMTEVKASSPQDQAQNVALDGLISMRFSQPVSMSSIGRTTVTFQGPEGIVDATIVAAEGGMLAFVNPQTTLMPGTMYSVKLAGAVDRAGQNVAFAEFVFTTTGETPAGIDDEAWSPTADWLTHREPSKFESLPDLQSAPGDTALAGQVLRLNGQPLQHVMLEIGQNRTESDDTGRFLLKDVPAGHQVLVIQGKTADGAGKKYGRFEWGAEIKAGVTNRLGFKIWMPVLDTAHEVRIPSPTTRETIVTTPEIPGLELRIPPDTVITDSDGKVVTKITITPIPLDRTPFPLPFVKVPIYFTIQPGGAYLSVKNRTGQGARLFYPNTEHLRPGVPFAFWNYSADQNGWFVYGAGHVNKEGTQIAPDPGVVIYEFSGAMVGSGNAGPPTGPNGGGAAGGEPVDLSSGLNVYDKSDLALADVIPIVLKRTYRPYDSWSRPFGIGTTHSYEIFVGGDGNSFSATPYVDLILPDGKRIHFIGVSTAPPFGSYLSSSAPGPWYGAVISASPVNPNHYVLPGSWHLQTKDGTIYSFPGSDGLVNPGCQALVGITDRNGNQVKISRNADAKCTINTITSPNGRSITFQYDTSFRVKTATDNSGRSVLYNYDGSGRLHTVTDANGGIWTYEYDSLNRMTTIQDPRQIIYLTNVYDPTTGALIRQVQADGGTYLFNWTVTGATANDTFSVVEGVGAPPPYSVTSFRYCSGCSEGYPTLVSQVDVTDPNQNVRRVVFNSYGYATSDTRALGKPEQQTTTLTYYDDNLTKSVTDQLGRVTSLDYDVNANPTTMTRLSGTPNAVTTTLTYDGTYARPMTITDPLGHRSVLTYDTVGNLTTLTDPLGHSTTFTHTGGGLVDSVTDALQNTTHFQYNLGNLIAITDPLLNTTATMFYDNVGRVTTKTDAVGRTVKYQYNNLDLVTQVTDPLAGITSLTYDLNGNLLTVQDARQQGTNNKTIYTYNNMDRLQTATDPLLRQESFTYDLNGNRQTSTDRRNKVTTFQFDGLNRLHFVGYGTTAGPSYESTTTYTYDGGSRLSSVLDSVSGTITPAFDGLNRLTSQTTSQGIITYTYDNASRRAISQVTGQPQIIYTFDDANRLKQVTQGTTVTTIGYDDANRRNSLTLPNGLMTTYGYDNDSRLTALTYQFGANPIGNLSYGYDPSGQRIQIGGSFARTGLPQAVASAVYDVGNELTNWNGTTIGYDANGNIQNDGAAVYGWNARNQLSSRGSVAYQYDAYGRRTQNAVGNKLLYDGMDATQELSGTTPVANRIVGGHVDEFFQRTDTGGASAPIADALASVLALVDASGNLTTQYSYDPFGGTTVYGSLSGNSFQYTGRENDANGLYYYRARYYNPTIGRFISEDPIGSGGTTNAYAYVHNNPLNFLDPLGMQDVPGCGPDCVRSPGEQTVIQQQHDAFMLGLELPGVPSPFSGRPLPPPPVAPTSGRDCGCTSAVAETVTGGVAILGGIAVAWYALPWLAANGFGEGLGFYEWFHLGPPGVPVILLYVDGIEQMTIHCN